MIFFVISMRKWLLCCSFTSYILVSFGTACPDYEINYFPLNKSIILYTLTHPKPAKQSSAMEQVVNFRNFMDCLILIQLLLLLVVFHLNRKQVQHYSTMEAQRAPGAYIISTNGRFILGSLIIGKVARTNVYVGMGNCGSNRHVGVE